MGERTDTVFREDLFGGQLALVTGGGTGIGLAIARLLGRLGARVVIAARSEERLERAAAALRAEGVSASAELLNIRDETQVADVFDRIGSEHGLPDFLINNAGGQFAAPSLEISANGFRAVIDLNLNGTWHMCRAYGSRLVEAARPGRIVNIVLCCESGMPGMAHASAARAGVVNLTKTLAYEWARHGITVNAIAPGTIETEALAQYDQETMAKGIAALPIPRMGTPLEVAELTAFLLSSAGSYITGALVPLDGGEHLTGASVN